MENAKRAKVTTLSDREIVITRVFDAPRSIVFEAWTKAEHVVHWWDPSGAPLSVCEIDLRPNGAFRFVNAKLRPLNASSSRRGTRRPVRRSSSVSTRVRRH
jgi:hypothetical protein